MDQQHPITPPLELLSKWEDEILKRYQNVDVQLINAYQAGADAELNACCGWIENQSDLGQLSFIPEVRAEFRREVGDRLRAARRPKPLSLKQQALEALDSFEGFTGSLEEVDIIRQALITLPDTET